MEKLHIVTIALVVSGIVFISVSLGTGVASIKGEYWIDYAYSTTVSATVSGFPATVVAVATANIGLYTTCYFIATTTTVTTMFGSTTTNINTNDCVDSATTGYISADTVTAIQKVAVAAAAMIGLALLTGIPVLVLTIIKKLPKPVCFISITPAIFSLISTAMVLAAILILNKELVSGMSLGNTATLGYIATVFAFLSTVSYTVAAVLVIKQAMTSSKTAPSIGESKAPQTPQDAENKEPL